MKLKKLMVAIASALVMVGCNNGNEPNLIPQEEEYVRAFIKKVGVFDENHTWCAAESGAVTIFPEQEVKELKVYGYTCGEYFLVADYKDVTTPQTIHFDMPSGTESIMAVADGVSYTAPINTALNLSAAEGMSMPSRAGVLNDEGYTWILAVEDMGGAYDFDFNDAVISVNVIKYYDYTEVAFTALAAGGTLQLYINFNLGESYTLYSGETSSISGTKLYPDGTSVDKAEFHNWFGSGYSTSTMINTGKGVNVPIEQCKKSTIYLAGTSFNISDYAKVRNGKLSGISLEVETSTGPKTVANNPTRVAMGEEDVIFKGPVYYYGLSYLIYEDNDALKNMTEKSVFEINLSINEKDSKEKAAQIEISHGIKDKDLNWQAEWDPLYKEAISSGELLSNSTEAGTLTLKYKPSLCALQHFKEGNMFVRGQGITLHYIKIVDPTQPPLTPEQEQEYLFAPQMFIIPDQGKDGKWQWPTETTCIVDAYAKFDDWCKARTETTNTWHTLQPTEGTVFNR